MVLPDGGKTCETHGERKRAVCIGYTSSSLSNEIEELCLHRCGQFNCLGISVSVLFFSGETWGGYGIRFLFRHINLDFGGLNSPIWVLKQKSCFALWLLQVKIVVRPSSLPYDY